MSDVFTKPLDQPNDPRGPERISVDLLKSYILSVISGWYGEHEKPLDSVEALAPYLDDVVSRATRDGTREVLRTGLELLLADPGLDLESLSSMHFPVDDAEMREVLTYLDARLSGPLSHALPTVTGGSATAVLDWEESGTNWLVRHGRLHLVRPGETLRFIAAEHGASVDDLLELNPYYRKHYGPDRKLTARPGETVVWLRRGPDMT